MLTCFRVEAVFGETQALDGPPFDDVRLHNLLDIGFADMSIPDRFGINHNVRSVLALVEASGLIGAHAAFQPMLGEFLLEDLLQPRFRSRIAASPRMARGALVSANEDMSFELGHP